MNKTLVKEPELRSYSGENERDERDERDERRAFLRKALEVAGVVLSGAALAQIVSSCESTTILSTGVQTALDISKESSLQTVGGAISRQFGQNNGGRNVIVVRIAADQFAALSSVCTHEQCTVSPPTMMGGMTGNLYCACHGATFSAKDGSVLGGPARSPLQQFQTSYSASTKVLTITF